MDNAIVLRSRTARLVSRSPGSTSFVKSTNELLRDTARWRVQIGLKDAAHESGKKSKLLRAEEKNCSGCLESTKASRSKGTLKPERNCYHVTLKLCCQGMAKKPINQPSAAGRLIVQLELFEVITQHYSREEMQPSKNPDYAGERGHSDIREAPTYEHARLVASPNGFFSFWDAPLAVGILEGE